MANARVRRGRRSQDVLAARWRESGLFPDARAVAAALPGRDVQETLGWSIEVKARRDFKPVEWLKQSSKNAGDDWPVVVMRPDGAGEADVGGKWLVFMSVETFEEIVRDLQQR